jgi:hypothetical protein
VLYCSLTLPSLSFDDAAYLIILPGSYFFFNYKIQHLLFNKLQSTILLHFYVLLNVIFQSGSAFYMKPSFSFLPKFYVHFSSVLQDNCNIFGEHHSHVPLIMQFSPAVSFLHLPWHRHIRTPSPRTSQYILPSM